MLVKAIEILLTFVENERVESKTRWVVSKAITSTLDRRGLLSHGQFVPTIQRLTALASGLPPVYANDLAGPLGFPPEWNRCPLRPPSQNLFG